MTTGATYSRTVTVDLPDHASATITFRILSTVAIAAGAAEIFPGKAYTLVLDANGVGSTALPCPDNTGNDAWLWRVELPDNKMPQFTLAYDASSVALSTLLSASISTVTASDLLAALALYLPLAGGTLSGEIGFTGTDHAGIKLLSLTTAQRDALTPVNGMVIYNSTTAQVEGYQAGAWGALGGGSSAWGAITGTLSSQTDLQTALNDKLDDADVGVSVQAYSAKTAAIAALTWAANSILLLTGTATAAVQAIAAHVVTLLASATAADARAAIGAGTGDGDVTGPGSSTDNAIARYNLATGKLLQNSTVTVDDNGNLDIPGANAAASYALRINATTGLRGFIDFSSTVLRIAGVSGISLAFFADNAERLRITNAGIGIGVTVNQGRIHSYDTGGGFLHAYKSGIASSAVAVITNGTGDVTLVLSGTFTVSDGAGNVAGGVITATAPGGTFDLYSDGGTNVCQLQVAADGSVTVVRTAGSRTYAVNLTLNWL